MRGVGVGVQQAYRDRRDALRAHVGDDAGETGEVERPDDPAIAPRRSSIS